MEMSRIILDDGTGDDFDKALEESDFKDNGVVKFVTKEKGTVEGKPVVSIGFKIDVNGIPKNVQITITAKLLVTAAKAIEAKYPVLSEQ